ncbi:3-keto-disaccharide hydrolase [Anatilimnocola floriformis]|uniref:3-keto-disaccharide hydrolase n=1 Tax=Anatilimnocola floriformis TaxID=2948575 RepID=UPI0020C4374A|nr:DUF1080 domain-containing protein [Anatilimnocola floriformis]
MLCRRLLTCCIGLLFVGYCFTAVGQDAATLHSTLRSNAKGVTYPLFNGKNLQGWKALKCEATVEDGKLVITGGDGLLRSESRYRNFVLDLDYKPRKEAMYDSGIYFRCEEPAAGKASPSRYQVNLKQGDELNLIKYPQARSTGLVKAGDWNHVKLTVIGDRAACEINGKEAWATDGIEAEEGYLGIQVEVPAGGQFEFKNIQVTEVGYESLFNGKDLAGWQGAGEEASACWQVEDGVLLCTGKKGPWLRSKQQYSDFDLRLEYKIRAAGNSGVYVHVPENGNHHGKDAGVEIQILDDFSPKYKTLKDWQYTGSVYDFAPAKEHVGREVGEWNSLQIECSARRYRITHNGVLIVDAGVTEFPGLAERLSTGYLGLQNHSEEVWFRNIRIKPRREM